MNRVPSRRGTSRSSREDRDGVEAVVSPGSTRAADSGTEGDVVGYYKRLGRRRLGIWLARIAVFVGFIGFWDFLVRSGAIDEFFLSRPRAVLDELVAMLTSGSVWPHAFVTFRSTFIGFGLGVTMGVLAGFALARSPTLDAIVGPYLAAINAMPRSALAPLFIVWFGIGPASKVWFAVSLVFFIVMINTQAGARAIDRELTTTATVLGATERQMFVKVILPGSVPAMFASLRLGFVYSLLAVVFGEMLAAKQGLGQQIALFAGTYRMAGVLATLAILGTLSMLFNWVIQRAETYLLRWQ